MDLNSYVQEVPYIGEKTAKLLKEKGILTIKDLWNHFPYRYEDTSRIFKVHEALNLLTNYEFLSPKSLPKITIEGRISQLQKVATRKKLTLIVATIEDSKTSDKVYAIWFNQTYLLNTLKIKNRYVFYGKPEKKGSSYQLINPEFEKYSPNLTHLGRITPVYPRIKSYTTKFHRRVMLKIRPTYIQFKEYLPWEILKQHDLVPINAAYLKLHFPAKKQDISEGYERLSIQEILELISAAPKPKHITPLKLKKLKDPDKYLPFSLTNDQRKAYISLINGINQGLSEIFLYGDVGTGKTAVAFLTALTFAEKGYSSVLMAPTSVLAYQHHQTISKWLKKLKSDIDVELVTQKTKTKLFTLKKPTILIGTHALLFRKFEDRKAPIKFVTVDEQHRFGTSQRDKLKDSRFILTMSATPIPRTLALTFYGYQKAIYIKQLPKGRKPIKTLITPEDKVYEMLKWIAQEVSKKNIQAYLVFPIIEGDIKEYGVKAWYEGLHDTMFKHLETDLLHGKLGESKKNQIMEKFASGKTQILFTTSVIEVGVDVPNANIMAIFGAERFGLAQLHQLRGRIGRGSRQAYCFIVGDPNHDRLRFFAKHSDGIKLAEYDLKHRGPGDIAYGISQAGWQKLKLADLSNLYLVRKALRIYESLNQAKIKIPKFIS